MARTINWNAPKLAALKAAYAQATTGHYLTTDAIKVELPDEKEPAEFVLSYAKYLIEYLDGEFARNPMPRFPENREGAEP